MKRYMPYKNAALRQLLTLLIAVGIPFFSWGQSVDSLELLLKKADLPMVEKIKLYDDLAWGYMDIDTRRSLDASKNGVKLALGAGDNKMEAIFYRNMGIAYYMGGVYDSARLYLDKASPTALKLGDTRLKASIHNAYGNLYRVQSWYDLALEAYHKSATILEQSNDIQGMAMVYGNMGGIYQFLRNYDQALHYFAKAEEMALKVDDRQTVAQVYTSRSDIYLYLEKDKEESIHYAEQAIKIYHEAGNRFSEIKAQETLGKVYYHYEDYHLALPIIRQAVQEAEDSGFPTLIASSLITLANIYYYTGDYHRCVETTQKAIQADSTNADLYGNAYANLSQSYARMGRFDLMEEYLQQYRAVVNSHSNESYQNSISEMEVKYEAEKKELKIAGLEKQRQLHTWLGIAGGIILLIVLAFIFIRYRLAVSRRKLAEEEAQRLEQEKQLVAVQATLDGEAAERARLAKDLHDGLGGMLSAVKLNLPQVKGEAVLEAMDVSRFQTALGMLDDSIQELRRVAHHMMPESLLRYGLKVSLSDFCNAIPTADFHYFGNEARLPGKMEIMVYRCIHELVNNALKHAEADHINVQLVQEPDRISFTVQDNGKGFDRQTVSEGMGLQNIQQRVDVFQGKLDIYSSTDGTEVHVELELTKNESHD